MHNLQLANIARNRRLIFFEGPDDYRILRRLAGKLGFTELAAGFGLTSFPCAGLSEWPTVRQLGQGLQLAVGADAVLSVGAVFRRSQWPSQSVRKVQGALRDALDFVHIYPRQQLENYLLSPEVLQCALNVAAAERRRVRPGVSTPDAAAILTEATDVLRESVQARVLGLRKQALGEQGGFDAVAEAERFARDWVSVTMRLELVNGKEVLDAVDEILDRRYTMTLTLAQLIEAVQIEDIPDDLRELISRLDAYRRGDAEEELGLS